LPEICQKSILTLPHQAGGLAMSDCDGSIRPMFSISGDVGNTCQTTGDQHDPYAVFRNPVQATEANSNNISPQPYAAPLNQLPTETLPTPTEVAQEDFSTKMGRVIGVAVEGTATGIGQSIKDSINDPVGTIGRIASGAGIGIALACMTKNPGFIGFAGRTIGTALGASFLLDVGSKERLDSLGNAVEKTWDSPVYADSSKRVFGQYVGKFAFDTGLMAVTGMAAGGIKGMGALGEIGAPGKGVGFLELEKQADGSWLTALSKDINLRKSGGQATLEMQNGFSHTWDKAPNVMSRVKAKAGEITTFSDGSKLTVSPQLVRFEAGKGDEYTIFNNDLQHKVSMLEHGRRNLTDPQTRYWGREFTFEGGPVVTQLSNGEVYVQHNQGFTTMSPKGVKTNLQPGAQSLDLMKRTSQSLPKLPELAEGRNGKRLLNFDTGLSLQIDQNGTPAFVYKGEFEPT
jgi:hypothetical protein